MTRPRFLVPLLLGLLLLGYSQVWTQTPAAAVSPPPPPDLGVPVQPQTLAAHKAAVQTRLAALGQRGGVQTEVETTRTMLEQTLKVNKAFRQLAPATPLSLN